MTDEIRSTQHAETDISQREGPFMIILMLGKGHRTYLSELMMAAGNQLEGPDNGSGRFGMT